MSLRTRDVDSLLAQHDTFAPGIGAADHGAVRAHEDAVQSGCHFLEFYRVPQRLERRLECFGGGAGLNLDRAAAADDVRCGDGIGDIHVPVEHAEQDLESEAGDG